MLRKSTSSGKPVNKLRPLSLAELIEWGRRKDHRKCDTPNCKYPSHEYNYCVVCVFKKRHIVTQKP